MERVLAIGRRKTAVAKAVATPGNGIYRINSKLLDTLPYYVKSIISEPLVLIGDEAKKFDVSVKVKGGGIYSQAEAARTAICKALCRLNKNLTKKILEYDRSFLVSDMRQKEEHKQRGHGKARAKKQKSYR